ncbi:MULTISPECIES: dihydrodipicolinate synthase family protein [Brevibacillus]|uniref:Dihydrodipicolinate synthase family protein n=1 Tax=Brevibacillus parabrevis TaxID=54914 RepID=A0A4Y3PMH0_BREPA|nr:MULTISPECIES: dihydrodipicolinate synthase family protein [Brevibacillus]MBU8714696.1 dihydrodipicolinate synthase family protein [Brevibacillus parabrevis]MDH6353136.1 4-hydroxy-tetrahydrodipicolinate synthase [Brevibacillus sp. 1238]MDR5001956.1 dihydrodipicolinate synthase family protein [Brevibacillus parabrevis]MED1724830.1 dihydrodipicolinate synthase family protein [Brevibacillus parabrevis]MED2254588.1 dihydrodipicolinate synthase family protein [Brevibacillus parabrevis]
MGRFEGVYVAIVTPFTSDYEVDYKRLTELCDWLIQEGVNGLVPSGSLGEYATMTGEERAKVIHTVIAAAKGRVPVVVGSAAPSTRQAVEWVQFSKDAGAAGVMALPPINYKPLENEVFAHYEALNTVGLPIIAYNNPHDYKIDLTPDILARLAKFENVVAVKEFSGDVRRMQDILAQTDLEVMVGVDDLVMEGGLIGATGWIAGVPNALPKEGVELFRLARAGKLAEAQALYRRLLPLFHYDASPQLVQSIKYMMELAGFPVGPTRPPRLPLADDYYAGIKKAFDYAVGAASGR